MAVTHFIEISEEYSGFFDDRFLTVIPVTLRELDDTYSDFSDEIINTPIITHRVEPLDTYSGFLDEIINTPIPTHLKEVSDIYSGFSDEILTEIIEAVPNIYLAKPSPGETIYSFIPKFEVRAYGFSQCFATLKLYDGMMNLIREWSPATMSYLGIISGKRAWGYSYTMDEIIDDYLLPGVYHIRFIVNNIAGEDVETVQFVIIEYDTELRLLNLEYQLDKSRLKFTFQIRNLNKIWVNVYPLLVNEYLNKEVNILEVNADKYVLRGNNILIKTTDEWQYFDILVEYKIKGELLDKSNLLNKDSVKINYKIIIEDIDLKIFDVTKFVTNIDFGRTQELNASQCTITFALNKSLSPFLNIDTPLFYGNKIKIYTYLENEETLEWQGYISSTDTSSTNITVVAFDKLINFNRRLQENLVYSPQKLLLNETLKAIDGVKFKGSYPSWSIVPPPKIWVKDILLKPGEYTIDYARGEIYIFKNPFLIPSWIDRIIIAEDMPDRQIIQLDFDINLSSAIVLKHSYMEKSLYSCVEGVEVENVWINRRELLYENIDFRIDYENEKIILNVALPGNTDTIKDHKIIFNARRDIGKVVAEYVYYRPFTNEVEDIITDLAKKIGFVESDLKNEIHNERIYSRDGISFLLSNRNVAEVLDLKVNNIPYLGYHVFKKEGLIDFDRFIPTSEMIIDSFSSLAKVTSNGILSLDNDAIVEKSIKAVLGVGGWIKKKYHANEVYLDLSNFIELAFLIKPEINLDYVTIALLDKNNMSLGGIKSSSVLIGNTWNTVKFDISGFSGLEEVAYIRLTVPVGCTLLINYLHVPKNEVKVSYKYNTIEPTGITLSEAWYMKKEIETYKDILVDILKQVEPSYSLWVDKNEKLIGKYIKMPFYYFLPAVYKYKGLEKDIVYGKFLLPDYTMKLLKSFSHNISDEQVFSAVQVIGKLSKKSNVALSGLAEDKNKVVGGKAYLGTEKYRQITVNYQPDAVKPLKRIVENQFSISVVEITSTNAKALNDGDVNSGMTWYKQQRNKATPPFSTDELLCEITLQTPIYWEEIVVTVGAFENKVIRQELYVKVVDENNNELFPEEETPTRKQGQTGTHLKWANTLFKHLKIKKIKIYGSQGFHYFTSEAIHRSGGKK